MTSLTSRQTQRLVRLMDRRFERELAEIDAVTVRARAEHSQEIVAGNLADHLDQALSQTTRDADAALVRQNVQDVRDIMAARRRLAAGTYGVCVDCGEDIGFPRLAAYPTAKRCIECQREHEGKATMRERRYAV